jgi:hypothetical protein
VRSLLHQAFDATARTDTAAGPGGPVVTGAAPRGATGRPVWQVLTGDGVCRYRGTDLGLAWELRDALPGARLRCGARTADPVPLRTAELERLVRARAGCRGRDPEAFYPVQVCPVIDRDRAHAACAGCPVTALCRELALRIPAGAHGIWGATSERDRAALRRRRHADPRARTGGAVA